MQTTMLGAMTMWWQTPYFGEPVSFGTRELSESALSTNAVTYRWKFSLCNGKERFFTMSQTNYREAPSKPC